MNGLAMAPARIVAGRAPASTYCEKEKAGTNALAPIPADSEQSAKSDFCEPEDISFTNGSRGDRRFTFPNEPVAAQLFSAAIAHGEEFTANEFFTLAEMTNL